MAKAIQIIGWYGVGTILTAFALVSFEVVAPRSLTFQILNATGALGILVEALAKMDYQPVVLNLIWIIIATVIIARILLGS